MEKRTFKHCTLAFLEEKLGLEQTDTLVSLSDWLLNPTDLTDDERLIVSHYRKLLTFNLHSWNEQELSLHFIGPLFGLIDFSSKKANLFAERSISAIIQDIELSGEPDGMIASGFRVPHKPFFAFHEYKKEVDADGHPTAQTLAAMVVGQAINEDNLPMYGCYVIGQNWYFMSLEGNKYAISGSYSAVQEDIWEIVGILKQLKKMVYDRVN